MRPCSFYLHYTDNLSAIAVPHRDDTDNIMADFERQLPTCYEWLVVVISSITHPFRAICEFSDFYETGNDIAPITPLGGVAW